MRSTIALVLLALLATVHGSHIRASSDALPSPSESYLGSELVDEISSGIPDYTVDDIDWQIMRISVSIKQGKQDTGETPALAKHLAALLPKLLDARKKLTEAESNEEKAVHEYNRKVFAMIGEYQMPLLSGESTIAEFVKQSESMHDPEVKKASLDALKILESMGAERHNDYNEEPEQDLE